MWWAVWISSFWPIIEVFYRPEGTKRGTTWKWILIIQKWILQTLRSEKVDEKNGVICLVSMFPSWVMVVKLFKKVIFCNFVLTSTRNLNLFKQFTYMHLKGLVTLSENSIVYYAITYHFGDISVWSWEILLNFCCISIFFDIIIVKFSWTVSQTSINHIIFWKTVMGTFRCIYVNCFNRLKFVKNFCTKL